MMQMQSRRGLRTWPRLAARASLREKLERLGMAEKREGAEKASLTVQDALDANYTAEAQYPPLRPRHVFYRSRDHPERMRVDDPAALAIQRDREAAYVAALPTVEEKIFHVSPFERDWNRRERRYHRVNHAPLVDARGAWQVPVSSAEQPYGSLKFLQHVCQTQTIDGLPDDMFQAEPQPKTLHSLVAEYHEALQEEVERTTPGQEPNNLPLFQNFLREAVARLGAVHPDMADKRLVLNPRQESFWVRSGFKHLYPTDELEDWNKRRKMSALGGDDGRLLGELAFCTKEKPLAVLLSRQPLEVLDAGALGELPPAEEVAYDPDVLGWELTRERLDQAAGFASPSASRPSHPFVHTSFWDSSAVYAASLRRGLEVEELDLALLAAAVSAAFSTAVANAHALGFTQLNDLTYPLRQNVVLTNGRELFFAAFQLNSLALQPHPESLNALWHSSGAFVSELFDLPQDQGRPVVASWNGTEAEKVLRLLSLPSRSVGAEEELTPLLGQPQPVPLHSLRDTSFEREQMTFDQTPPSVPDDELEQQAL